MKKISTLLATILLATVAQAQFSTLPVSKPVTCYQNENVYQNSPYLATINNLTKKELNSLSKIFKKDGLLKIEMVINFSPALMTLTISVDDTKVFFPQVLGFDVPAAMDQTVQQYLYESAFKLKIKPSRIVTECNHIAEAFGVNE